LTCPLPWPWCLSSPAHRSLPREKAALLRGWDRVLGLDLDRAGPKVALPAGAAELLEAREQAREVKDFVRADQLRNELAQEGVIVTDTPEGQRWKVGAKKGGRTSRPGPTP